MAFALTSCGALANGSNDGGGDGSDGVVGRDVPPDEQGGSATPSPTVVSPRPGMLGVHAIEWERAEIAEDGRTLTVYFWSGVYPCYVLDHVVVQPQQDRLVITLFEGSAPDAQNAPCPDIGVYKAVTVRLDDPAGGRELVDGASSATP